MPDKNKLQEIVHKSIRKCTVDLNQAEGAFDNSQYNRYEENLDAVIKELSNLIESTKSKID